MNRFTYIYVYFIHSCMYILFLFPLISFFLTRYSLSIHRFIFEHLNDFVVDILFLIVCYAFIFSYLLQ